MPFLVADAADLTDVSIQKIWLKEAIKQDKSYEKIYGIETGVVDLFVKDSSLSGFGYAGRIVENAAATEKTPFQGYKQTYTQAQYGLVFTISKLQWKFGIKKRKLEQITSEVMKSVANLRALRLHEKLDQSYNSSYVAQDIAGNYTISLTGGNGVALISNAQTREDAGTNNNNRITDGTTLNLDLTYEGIKGAMRTGQLIKDPNGLPMNINLDTLIVAKNTANHFKAMELLGSIKRGYIGESADRDGNALPAFDIYATPWILSNPGYWWMMDTSMKDGAYGSLQYKESQPIELSPVNIIYKTGELQWKVELIMAWGHNDYRNIVGSKGTRAA